MSSERVPISAEIRGRYRIWRAAVQLRADRIEAASRSRAAGFAFGNFRSKKGKGRARALCQLRRIFEGAGALPVEFREDAASWAFLQPLGDEITTTIIMVDQQNCGLHSWILTLTDHALQRAMQRSAPGLDLTGLIWDAVDSTRRLSVPFLVSETTPDRFRIAAGDGAFACEWALVEHKIGTSANEMPMVRARTWLAADQMSSVQEAEIVIEGQPGQRLDDAYQACRAEWILPPLAIRRRNAPAR